MSKGMVIVATDRCKGCGLCTHVCPSACLALATEGFNARGYRPVQVTEPADCIGCGSCALVCPDVVFTVYRARQQSRSVTVGAAVPQEAAP